MRNFLVGLILICYSGILNAQQNKLTQKQKDKFNTQLTIYFEVLNLSDAQKPKFKEIAENFELKVHRIKAKSKGKRSNYRLLKKYRKKKNTAMKELLTDGQFNTYLLIEEEMNRPKN